MLRLAASLSGDSAGGNLTAAVCLKLRDEKVVPAPRLQALIYPCLQCTDLNQPSYQQNKDGLMLSRRLMAEFWTIYATGEERLASTMLRNRHVPEAAEDHLDHNHIDRKFRYKPYKPVAASSSWEGDLGKHADVLQNPYFAPLMAASLSDLPEVYMFTAQHDVLRDDGLLYVRRLREAGVKVTHKHCDIGYHGMISMFKDVPEANDCLMEMCSFLSVKFKV